MNHFKCCNESHRDWSEKSIKDLLSTNLYQASVNSKITWSLVWLTYRVNWIWKSISHHLWLRISFGKVNNLRSQKISETTRLSDAFREYKKRWAAWNRLKVYRKSLSLGSHFFSIEYSQLKLSKHLQYVLLPINSVFKVSYLEILFQALQKSVENCINMLFTTAAHKYLANSLQIIQLLQSR